MHSNEKRSFALKPFAVSDNLRNSRLPAYVMHMYSPYFFPSLPPPPQAEADRVQREQEAALEAARAEAYQQTMSRLAQIQHDKEAAEAARQQRKQEMERMREQRRQAEEAARMEDEAKLAYAHPQRS